VAIALDNVLIAMRNQKDREKLGKTIQRFRKSIGISQEQLAEKLHISRTHVGHVEQGRKSPSFELLGKVARTLKVKLKDLMP